MVTQEAVSRREETRSNMGGRHAIPFDVEAKYAAHAAYPSA